MVRLLDNADLKKIN